MLLSAHLHASSRCTIRAVEDEIGVIVDLRIPFDAASWMVGGLYTETDCASGTEDKDRSEVIAKSTPLLHG